MSGAEAVKQYRFFLVLDVDGALGAWASVTPLEHDAALRQLHQRLVAESIRPRLIAIGSHQSPPTPWAAVSWREGERGDLQLEGFGLVPDEHAARLITRLVSDPQVETAALPIRQLDDRVVRGDLERIRPLLRQGRACSQCGLRPQRKEQLNKNGRCRRCA